MPGAAAGGAAAGERPAAAALPHHSYLACAQGLASTTLFSLPETPAGCEGFRYTNSVGFSFEQRAVCAAVSAGRLECAEYTLDETLAVAALMDEVRRQLGVTYDADADAAAESA